MRGVGEYLYSLDNLRLGAVQEFWVFSAAAPHEIVLERRPRG